MTTQSNSSLGEKSLVYLHLSDIHFTRRSNSNYDPDYEIRESLVREAVEVRNAIGKCNGVIVCGDIAFSGLDQEYATAREWLSGLCNKLGCPVEAVWTIPGNHDVDRSSIKSSNIIRLSHSALRAKKSDEAIGDTVRDPEEFEIILRPLSNYLDFASQYACRPEKGKLYWIDDQLLSDGSILRFRGCNSAIVSDDKDDQNENKLVVGSYQVTGDGDPGITNLVICHHPLDWLHDADNLRDWLKARARVVLFGHKHVQCIEKTENTLFIHSGAVHPDRSEGGWCPRFNFLVMDVVKESSSRFLKVETWSRYWDDKNKRFRIERDSNENPIRTDCLELQAWDEPLNATSRGESSVSSISTEMVQGVNAKRALVYRFYGLPYVSRMQIATDLGLIDNADANLTDDERYALYFQRADSRKMLGKLWLSVERKHGNDLHGDNPFLTENNDA